LLVSVSYRLQTRYICMKESTVGNLFTLNAVKLRLAKVFELGGFLKRRANSFKF
jgi:hypothetical protein